MISGHLFAPGEHWHVLSIFHEPGRCWPEACVRASYTPTYDASKMRLTGFHHIPVGLAMHLSSFKEYSSWSTRVLNSVAKGLLFCAPVNHMIVQGIPLDHPFIHFCFLTPLNYTIFWTCFPFRAFCLLPCLLYAVLPEHCREPSSFPSTSASVHPSPRVTRVTWDKLKSSGARSKEL